MESKTLSKADQLKGLVELQQNPFHQMLLQAAEVEVQACLSQILHPSFFEIPDANTKLISMVGEMRGLRQPKIYLESTIASLSQEVKQQQEGDKPPQQQEQEI
jgi:hypothetical protein